MGLCQPGMGAPGSAPLAPNDLAQSRLAQSVLFHWEWGAIRCSRDRYSFGGTKKHNMLRQFITFIFFLLALLSNYAIAQTEQMRQLPGGGTPPEEQLNGAFKMQRFVARPVGLEQAIQPPPESKHVVDSRFLFVNGGYALAAAYDGATTQWFLHNTRAYEVNPLFGRHPSTARLWGEGSALTATMVFGSYELKKHHSRFWWLPPAVGMAAHTFAASHNLRLR